MKLADILSVVTVWFGVAVKTDNDIEKVCGKVLKTRNSNHVVIIWNASLIIKVYKSNVVFFEYHTTVLCFEAIYRKDIENESRGMIFK